MPRLLLILSCCATLAGCRSPVAPDTPVCTVEDHALTPVTRYVNGTYELLDPGPLTPVTVCR